MIKENDRSTERSRLVKGLVETRTPLYRDSSLPIEQLEASPEVLHEWFQGIVSCLPLDPDNLSIPEAGNGLEGDIHLVIERAKRILNRIGRPINVDINKLQGDSLGEAFHGMVELVLIIQFGKSLNGRTAQRLREDNHILVNHVGKHEFKVFWHVRISVHEREQFRQLVNHTPSGMKLPAKRGSVEATVAGEFLAVGNRRHGRSNDLSTSGGHDGQRDASIRLGFVSWLMR